MNTISVIIPVYNRLNFVGAAIDSVLHQTGSVDTQIIVVDDGSRINIAPAVRKYGQRIELHRKANGGPASARNFGLARAYGTWAVFLDDDDYLEPQALEKLLAAAQRENTEWSVGRFAYVDADGRDLPRQHGCRFQSGHVFHQMIQHNLMGATSTVLVRTEAVRAVGGFDEDRAVQICEDYDLWLRLAHRFPIAAINDRVTNYRMSLHQATVNWSKLYRVRLHVLEKNRRLCGPEFTSEFDRSIARSHLAFGDDLYTHDEVDEARNQWRKAAQHECGATRLHLLSRFTKSYLPKWVLNKCRRLASYGRAIAARIRFSPTVESPQPILPREHADT